MAETRAESAIEREAAGLADAALLGSKARARRARQTTCPAVTLASSSSADSIVVGWLFFCERLAEAGFPSCGDLACSSRVGLRVLLSRWEVGVPTVVGREADVGRRNARRLSGPLSALPSALKGEGEP